MKHIYGIIRWIVVYDFKPMHPVLLLVYLWLTMVLSTLENEECYITRSNRDMNQWWFSWNMLKPCSALWLGYTGRIIPIDKHILFTRVETTNYHSLPRSAIKQTGIVGIAVCICLMLRGGDCFAEYGNQTKLFFQQKVEGDGWIYLAWLGSFWNFIVLQCKLIYRSSWVPSHKKRWHPANVEFALQAIHCFHSWTVLVWVWYPTIYGEKITNPMVEKIMCPVFVCYLGGAPVSDKPMWVKNWSWN